MSELTVRKILAVVGAFVFLMALMSVHTFEDRFATAALGAVVIMLFMRLRERGSK
jgi:uncharacterized membrane protein